MKRGGFVVACADEWHRALRLLMHLVVASLLVPSVLGS